MLTENSGHTGISSFFFAHIFQVIPDILTGKFFFLTGRKKSFKEPIAMKGPVEPVHRSVPETIQEVIELTGFHCFLFRSTPSRLKVTKSSTVLWVMAISSNMKVTSSNKKVGEPD